MAKFVSPILWTVISIWALLCPVDAALAPSLTANNIVTTIFEQETSTVSLADLSCTDSDGPNTPPLVISLASIAPSGAPCSNCFQVYPQCGGGLGVSYCLQFLPIGTLDFDKVNTYYLTLTCKDNQGDPLGTLTIDLRLTPNLPPFFASGSVTSTMANTENVNSGGSVYDASCSDPDSDALTYTMTSTPSSSLFTIDANGVIRATGDLSAACFTSITFQVYCKDPYNAARGPIYIQIALNGANQRPAVTGISYSLDVTEDTAVGSTMATYTVTDDDSPACLLFANPQESLQYFALDSSQRSIVVKSKLNYEQSATRNTNLTVTCSDGYCTSASSYLYVRVTDVNEPITLYPQNFILSTYEGQISLDPKWTPIDEDLNDTPFYTIVSGNANGRFAIVPSTGLIYSTLEYDVDQPSPMPTKDYLVVKVTDEAGHTSTTTVSLTILDRNDNKPTFVGSQNAHTFTVTNCTSSIGQLLGTVTATDVDSSYQGNNVLTYSGSSGSIAISATGNILVGSNLIAGNTYTVAATATDAGQYLGTLSSDPPAYVTVFITACPPTTTTVTTTAATTTPATIKTATTAVSLTQAPNTSNSTDANLGWIIIAGLLATILVAAVGLMLYKFCYPAWLAGGAPGRGLFYDCCTPRAVPREVQPFKGQPPRNGNKGFWQERYPDDDYKDQPNRDRTPTPAPMEGNGPLGVEAGTSWRPRALEYY